MSIIVALNHITSYHYDRPVTLGAQKIRLRPTPHARNEIQAYSLNITPGNHFINWQQDPFGNFLARVDFLEKLREFLVEVDLLTEIRVFNPFDFFLEDYAEKFPFQYEDSLREELGPYLEIKEQGEGLMSWLAQCETHAQQTIDFLVSINQKLNQSLGYTVRLEPGIQSCEETLSLGSGSCRDMAWFLCQALRHLGLATRFSSGYLIQLAPDVKSLDGPSGTSVDFTDLHAWTEVYLPGAGWIGLDPTSGLFAGEGHIPLCCTPNPSSAAPISGTLEGGANATLHHEMSVRRISESPRVTKPYSAAQWAQIDAVGQQVDARLSESDVRLTMGGEPTFVSIDDREHDTWHFEALGGEKKELAKGLASRLRAQFATGALQMFTQGKWYPGEILPRWAMPIFWRADETPLWWNENLLADPDQDLGHTSQIAKQFLQRLGHKLGIPAHYVLPAREDTPYYLWKDGRMPLTDEVMSADVFESAERKRLQTLFDQNLNDPVGFVLPLHFSHRRRRWISNSWEFKGDHLVLLTGDSPLGFRLPLSSLPWPDEAQDEVVPERAFGDMLDPLPTRSELEAQLAAYEAMDDATFRDDPNGLIHTAICAEVRGGVLCIFLPPVAWSEHILELITAIEAVAQESNVSVVLEGYTPMRDPRLLTLSVTPDPGVIEVNVQPAKDWESLKRVANTVYEEARLSRLSTEKYMLDGRRAGTGGGNHIVLGAMHPEDSPFLRRPDLLKSLIAFWQNHPSLSYLFSGTYIGPTSQSPRIDEARHDSLYELEIAFQRLDASQATSPWLVDRLLRNLLVDLTGNTHRAEFCIDKLFSPDSERGRLGLLEMRGFEMSPHPQMSLVQGLFLRSCVGCFWEAPYNNTFIRWGSQLHDKFMLSHFIREDLCAALDVLRAHGVAIEPAWFDPFLEFRFQQCGTAQIGDVTLTLRTALEPWPVMGEEPVGGGVSRSVDASVERVELTVTGLVPGRHQVTCNGRAVPLKPTAEANKYVAGIRFKAWKQVSSLHPEMPVHSPLVFDLVDTVNEKSLGGLTYHVSHPGGRNFDSYPVNEHEAEGRRLARFSATGHSQGRVQRVAETINDHFPYTLDLRYQAD